MFATNLKEKIILYKQKKCIKAIQYVIEEDNLKILKTAESIINRHTIYIDSFDGIDSLRFIRGLYEKDLVFKKVYYEKKLGNEEENLLIKKSISDDLEVIELLNDSFIDSYNKIVSYMNYITRNSEYLTEEQIIGYLCNYYRLTSNNVKYDMVKSKIVK